MTIKLRLTGRLFVLLVSSASFVSHAVSHLARKQGWALLEVGGMVVIFAIALPTTLLCQYCVRLLSQEIKLSFTVERPEREARWVPFAFRRVRRHDNENIIWLGTCLAKIKINNGPRVGHKMSWQLPWTFIRCDGIKLLDARTFITKRSRLISTALPSKPLWDNRLNLT